MGTEILTQLIVERDRRLATPSPWVMHLGAHNHGWGTHAFRCDVWLARTVLQLQHPSKAISNGKIARWMVEKGMTHGYAHTEKSRSLQTMVSRAQKAIAVLEALKVSKTSAPYWPAFTPTDAGA